MPHVVIVSYTGSEEDAAPFVRDHVAYLERHHADGVFLVSGPTVPSSQGGAILAHGVDRETIERISAEDPVRRERRRDPHDHHNRARAGSPGPGSTADRRTGVAKLTG
ncbi:MULTISPECIES: YciI family protein [unclassified Microbispora]|uniref:YciI family protein n=1 Tax=unclassified Microbispora TaxID=2614687 RepID=UPI00197BBCE5|nr:MULTISPECIES: YciI family protein [unclassified Microbispora]